MTRYCNMRKCHVRQRVISKRAILSVRTCEAYPTELLRLEPPQKRQRANACQEPDCRLAARGFHGGRACLRLREARAVAAAPQSRSRVKRIG